MKPGALAARAALFAAAAFAIVGPLTSLGVWSLAERWTYPSPWPQRFGVRYWQRVLSGDFLEPLRVGVTIAVVVTLLALALAIPLGYALARLSFPGRTAVLLLFLLPQAFPSSPSSRAPRASSTAGVSRARWRAWSSSISWAGWSSPSGP